MGKYPLKAISGEAVSAVMDVMVECGHLMQNPDTKEEWGYSYGNEIVRLAQGMPGRVEGTDTVKGIAL